MATALEGECASSARERWKQLNRTSSDTTKNIDLDWVVRAAEAAYGKDAEALKVILDKYQLKGESEFYCEGNTVSTVYSVSANGVVFQGILRFRETGEVSILFGVDEVKKTSSLPASIAYFLVALIADKKAMQTTLNENATKIFKGATVLYGCGNAQDSLSCAVAAEQNLKQAKTAIIDKEVQDIVFLAKRIYQRVRKIYHTPEDQEKIETTFNNYSTSAIPSLPENERLQRTREMINTMLETSVGARACVDFNQCDQRASGPENWGCPQGEERGSRGSTVSYQYPGTEIVRDVLEWGPSCYQPVEHNYGPL